MGVYIITSRVSGSLGFDKSIIQTANHLSEFYDVNILTIGEYHDANLYGDISTQTTKFELNNNVKTNCLRRINTGKTMVGKTKRVQTEILPWYKTKQDEETIEFLINFLDEKDFVIVANETTAFWLTLFNVVFPCKSNMQVHFDLEQTTITKKLLPQILKLTTFINPVAENMIPRLKELSGRIDEEFIVLPNFMSEIEPIRKKPSEIKNIAIIGSLDDRKDQIKAVKIFNEMKSKNSKLLIYGFGKENYLQKLNNVIDNSRRKDDIYICNYATEHEIYNKVDIVISTSKVEGFPYVLLEACKHNKPIVTLDFKYGSDEACINGENGFVIADNKEFTIQKFAESLDQICTNNELFQRFSEFSGKHYDKKFQNKRIIEKYINLIGKQKSNEKSITSYVQKYTPFTYEKINFRGVSTFKVKIKNDILYDDFTYDGADVRINYSFSNEHINLEITTNSLTEKTNIYGKIGDQKLYLFTIQEEIKHFARFDEALKESEPTILMTNNSWLVANTQRLKLPNLNETVYKYETNQSTNNAIDCFYIKNNCKEVLFNKEEQLFKVNRPVLNLENIISIFETLEKDPLIANYHLNGCYLFEVIKPHLFYKLCELFSLPAEKDIENTSTFGNENQLEQCENFKGNKIIVLSNMLHSDNSNTNEYGIFLLQEPKLQLENTKNVYDMKKYHYMLKNKVLNGINTYNFENVLYERIYELTNIRFFDIISINKVFLEHIAEYEFWIKYLANHQIKEIQCNNSFYRTGLIRACYEMGTSIKELQDINSKYLLKRNHYIVDDN